MAKKAVEQKPAGVVPSASRWSMTNERCWRCHITMYGLTPPLDGWKFYCSRCKALMLTAADLESWLAHHTEEGLGKVAGVPIKLLLGDDDTVSVDNTRAG